MTSITDLAVRLVVEPLQLSLLEPALPGHKRKSRVLKCLLR